MRFRQGDNHCTYRTFHHSSTHLRQCSTVAQIYSSIRCFQVILHVVRFACDSHWISFRVQFKFFSKGTFFISCTPQRQSLDDRRTSPLPIDIKCKKLTHLYEIATPSEFWKMAECLDFRLASMSTLCFCAVLMTRKAASCSSALSMRAS